MTRHDMKELMTSAPQITVGLPTSNPGLQNVGGPEQTSILKSDSYALGMVKSYPNVFWDLLVTCTDLMELQLSGAIPPLEL